MPSDGASREGVRGERVPPASSSAFAGKRVVVTGAAHGLGRAIALGFAERGAEVFACDVLEEELGSTGKLSRGLAGSLSIAVVDVTERDAVHRFVGELESAAGTVDILVNDAGGVLGQVGRPLEEVSQSDWQAIFDVNLSGAFYLCQAVAPGMKRAGAGRIVNVSSGAGLGVSLTGIQAYAAAKAGLIGLTRQLAHELGPWGITVNSVAPGFVRSNPTTEKQWQALGEDGQRRLLAGIALRRTGEPSDIAAGVFFFASEAASWVTGQTLAIDGGR